jgi:hypothetical protein
MPTESGRSEGHKDRRKVEEIRWRKKIHLSLYDEWALKEKNPPISSTNVGIRT